MGEEGLKKGRVKKYYGDALHTLVTPLVIHQLGCIWNRFALYFLFNVW